MTDQTADRPARLRFLSDPSLAALLTAQHANLFSPQVVRIEAAAVAQMQAVILAAEKALAGMRFRPSAACGVFMGYDFHLDAKGVHLIEINTNAGGAFLSAWLYPEQTRSLQQSFVEMFAHEWSLERGAQPLRTIAIVDEVPSAQFLYPEFMLAQTLFQQQGWQSMIADPRELEYRAEGVFIQGTQVDMVYNRLTDFALANYPQLRAAHQARQVVLTPHPAVYAQLADKRRLVTLSDGEALRALGMNDAEIALLQQTVPRTHEVASRSMEEWWVDRKSLFFKPISGYGSKGAYRGDKLTQRVFAEICQGEYVAQQLSPPAEVVHTDGAGREQRLKFDLRCYAYQGRIQLVVARLYQGQTTNFRTPGGGFARVEWPV